MKTITITQSSFEALTAKNAIAWRDGDSFFAIPDLIPEAERDLIEAKKNYRLNALIPEDRQIRSDRYPGDINYNTGLTVGLVKEIIDYFGLRVAQVWNQTIDPTTGQEIDPVPVVFERYFYNWNVELKRPVSRRKEISFYYDDGSLDPSVKILPKVFATSTESNEISYIRRKTIRSWIIARAEELGMAQNVEDFFSFYKEETDNYVVYGDPEIIDKVRRSLLPWMNKNTRTYMGTVRESIILSFGKAIEATPDEEVTDYLNTAFS